MQLWTITDAAGTVLAASFRTPSAGSHPRSNGWAWQEGQKATRIDRAPDLGAQKWSGAAWVDDLDALRDRRWDAVRAARDGAQGGGCVGPLGRVDTDPASQLRIAGAVQMAMIAQAAGQPFSIDWTMHDNTIVTHDAEAMIAMGMAVGRYVTACHEAATAKRAALADAQDAAQIAAIDPAADWPA